MSRIEEYIKLIPEGMKNAGSIVKAVIASINPILPEEDKREIFKRRVICNSCPFNSENAQTSEEYFLLTEGHYLTDRRGLHCSFCGCPIRTRTAALDKNCGIESWNEQHPDKTIELKWTATK